MKGIFTILFLIIAVLLVITVGFWILSLGVKAIVAIWRVILGKK